MKIMKIFYFFSLFLFSLVGAKAQNDSARFSAPIFSSNDTITRNDYLLSIEKVYQTLNKASVLSQPVPTILGIIQDLNEDDSAINIIRERLNISNRALNIRNLQMFGIILKQINKSSKSYARQLNQYDSILSGIKGQIFELKKDSLLRQLIRDQLLRASFQQQINQLRTKWKKTDSLIKYVNLLIDNAQARTSNNIIATDELQLQTQNLIKTTGSRAFSKESFYLWQFPKKGSLQNISNEFEKTIQSERKITNFYFSHTHNQLLLLLLCGIGFFFWVFYNYKSLKKLGKTDSLIEFDFRYINPVPIFASLIVMLNLAPLFDLDAPFIYIASVEFLLMLTLTYSFWKRLPGQLFYLWLIFIILFLLQSTTRYFGLSEYLTRWFLFILNTLSVLLAVYALSGFKNKYKQHNFLILSVALYGLFNFFSVVCNLFGRVTLMQIFGSTGIYELIQTAGLLVFIESVTEAFLLQIQSSRMRKEYTSDFDHKEIGRAISRLVIFWSVIIWLIVFATNLNIYNSIINYLGNVFNESRSIGSFKFTWGGVILFVVIIWVANFIQKYISYFFGDIGDDALFNSKGERSKLMIIKLILLVAGFLLAVAASGLAIDKVTVILGALSVGIGLGLQNIVNNFVSGIILIFDRTLHIGDTVEIGDKKGRVKQISMRSSTLLTAEGAEVIIPNGIILSKDFVNWSLNENYIRVDLTFNVSKVNKEIREQILQIIKSSPHVVSEKEPEILINTVTSQATQLKIYFWCEDVTEREMAQSEVYSAVSKYLEEQEIKIT